MTRGNLRIQFVSDALVQQIIEGRKTASVVELGELLFQDLAQTQTTVTAAILGGEDSTRQRHLNMVVW